MTISNNQAVGLALIPGAAEMLERRSIIIGNMSWIGMAKAVKYTRNALYCGVALAIIGAIGAAIGTTGAPFYISTITAALGTIITICATKALYDATLSIQRAINSGARPN